MHPSAVITSKPKGRLGGWVQDSWPWSQRAQGVAFILAPTAEMEAIARKARTNLETETVTCLQNLRVVTCAPYGIDRVGAISSPRGSWSR